MAVADIARLAGTALGAIGGALLFVEFFQVPSYISYQEDIESYDVDMMPDTVSEYTGFGRAGAFCIALGFALLFVATLLG